MVAAMLVWMIVAAGSAMAFDLQGHRGARGLAPENTLPAFMRALELGVDTLELDTGISREGVVVIAHDSRLNPDITRDASGAWIAEPGAVLHQLTLSQIASYDVGRVKPGTRYAQSLASQQPIDGTRIPTLAELFDAVTRREGSGPGKRVRFNIETKLSPLAPELTPSPEQFAHALLEVVRAHGMRARVTVQSFDWRTLRVVQRLEPSIPTVCLTARRPGLDNLSDARWTDGLKLTDVEGSVPRLVKAAGGAIWSPHHAELTAQALHEAHALGLWVVVWTVNEPAQME
jgi:glycerophosphoryl diester phosphodiesterase